MQRVLSIFMAILLAACSSAGGIKQSAPSQAATSTNPYTNAYQPLERQNVALSPDPTGPKLYRGNDKNRDNNRMLVKGFDMLGYSNFQGNDVSPDKALEHARMIKADLVLLYTRVSSTTPSSVKIQQMRDQAKNAKDGKVDIQEDEPRYSYYASFWVKLAPPVIGMHVEGLPASSNKQGLKVLAVVEGSPADKAGLKENDIIKKIGDITILKTASLAEVVKQYQGKTVPVVFERNEETVRQEMTLNRKQ